VRLYTTFFRNASVFLKKLGALQNSVRKTKAPAFPRKGLAGVFVCVRIMV